MLFRGPLEHSGTQRHNFEAPVEARYVRLEPQTWKHAIALQFELFGCVNMTIMTTRKPVIQQCTDRMGIEVGRISDDQITFSSVLQESEFQHGIEQVRLDHGGVSSGWRPAISSRQEWIRVDLLEPRNLSGLLTQGGNGNAWVESFIGMSKYHFKTHVKKLKQVFFQYKYSSLFFGWRVMEHNPQRRRWTARVPCQCGRTDCPYQLF